jgi:hypothetical protein
MSMSDNRHDSSDEKDSLINDLRVSLNKSIKETSISLRYVVFFNSYWVGSSIGRAGAF